MIAAVSGSRSINDATAVIKALRSLSASKIVCGNAKTGVDPIVAEYATANSISLQIVPPNWARYGRGAGLKANDEILAEVDCALAIYDGKSKGTGDFIAKARKKRIMLQVVLC